MICPRCNLSECTPRCGWCDYLPTAAERETVPAPEVYPDPRHPGQLRNHGPNLSAMYDTTDVEKEYRGLQTHLRGCLRHEGDRRDYRWQGIWWHARREGDRIKCINTNCQRLEFDAAPETWRDTSRIRTWTRGQDYDITVVDSAVRAEEEASHPVMALYTEDALDAAREEGRRQERERWESAIYQRVSKLRGEQWANTLEYHMRSVVADVRERALTDEADE